MEANMMQYPPGDHRLVDKIVCQLKSQGIFDRFRKECIADVDTKPAYQNLHQRVEGTVASFLADQEWRPDLNKNQLRDSLRKHIHESGFLDLGVERIVDQVVNPKIVPVLLPQIEDVVYNFLGLEKPKQTYSQCVASMQSAKAFKPVKMETLEDLLPKDLDPISPGSSVGVGSDDENDVDIKRDIKQEKDDEDKMLCEEEDSSPPFEPIEKVESPDENSMDSHVSGLSGLTSHGSQSNLSFTGEPVPPPITVSDASMVTTTAPAMPLKIPLAEESNQDSQLSKVSSSSRLSIVFSDEPEKSEHKQSPPTSDMDVQNDETQMSLVIHEASEAEGREDEEEEEDEEPSPVPEPLVEVKKAVEPERETPPDVPPTIASPTEAAVESQMKASAFLESPVKELPEPGMTQIDRAKEQEAPKAKAMDENMEVEEEVDREEEKRKEEMDKEEEKRKEEMDREKEKRKKEMDKEEEKRKEEMDREKEKRKKEMDKEEEKRKEEMDREKEKRKKEMDKEEEKRKEEMDREKEKRKEEMDREKEKRKEEMDKEEEKRKEELDKEKEKRKEERKRSSASTESRDSKRSESNSRSSDGEKRKSDKYRPRHEEKKKDKESKGKVEDDKVEVEEKERTKEKQRESRSDKERTKEKEKGQRSEDKAQKEKVKEKSSRDGSKDKGSSSKEKTKRDESKESSKEKEKESSKDEKSRSKRDGKEDKSKRSEKDSSREKTKKDTVDGVKSEETEDDKKIRSQSETKKERPSKEKTGKSSSSSRHSERSSKARHDDKDSKHKEGNAKLENKEKQEISSGSKGSGDKSQGKEGKSKTSEKKDGRKEKEKEKDKGKEKDKEKEKSGGDAAGKTLQKKESSRKKEGRPKSGVADDHAAHRDRQSDDRRSTDRDSNGAAKGQSAGRAAQGSATSSSSSSTSSSKRHERRSGGGSGGGSSGNQKSQSESQNSEGGGGKSRNLEGSGGESQNSEGGGGESLNLQGRGAGSKNSEGSGAESQNSEGGRDESQKLEARGDESRRSESRGSESLKSGGGGGESREAGIAVVNMPKTPPPSEVPAPREETTTPSPQLSLPLKKRPISTTKEVVDRPVERTGGVQGRTEAEEAQESLGRSEAVGDVPEYACVNNSSAGRLLLKLKKPRIAANVFEVRKILHMQKNMERKQKGEGEGKRGGRRGRGRQQGGRSKERADVGTSSTATPASSVTSEPATPASASTITSEPATPASTATSSPSAFSIPADAKVPFRTFSVKVDDDSGDEGMMGFTAAEVDVDRLFLDYVRHVQASEQLSDVSDTSDTAADGDERQMDSFVEPRTEAGPASPPVAPAPDMHSDINTVLGIDEGLSVSITKLPLTSLRPRAAHTPASETAVSHGRGTKRRMAAAEAQSARSEGAKRAAVMAARTVARPPAGAEVVRVDPASQPGSPDPAPPPRLRPSLGLRKPATSKNSGTPAMPGVRGFNQVVEVKVLDVEADNNNIDKSSSDDEKTGGEPLSLSNELISSALRDLMVESGMRVGVGAGVAAEAETTAPTPATPRPGRGRGRRLGLARPQPPPSRRASGSSPAPAATLEGATAPADATDAATAATAASEPKVTAVQEDLAANTTDRQKFRSETVVFAPCSQRKPSSGGLQPPAPQCKPQPYPTTPQQESLADSLEMVRSFDSVHPPGVKRTRR